MGTGAGHQDPVSQGRSQLLTSQTPTLSPAHAAPPPAQQPLPHCRLMLTRASRASPAQGFPIHQSRCLEVKWIKARQVGLALAPQSGLPLRSLGSAELWLPGKGSQRSRLGRFLEVAALGMG